MIVWKTRQYIPSQKEYGLFKPSPTLLSACVLPFFLSFFEGLSLNPGLIGLIFLEQ